MDFKIDRNYTINRAKKNVVTRSGSFHNVLLKNLPHDRPKPLNAFLIQLIAGWSTFNNPRNPAGILKDFKVLWNGGLGNR